MPNHPAPDHIPRVWRAACQKPLLWLPAALTIVTAQSAVAAAWIVVVTVTENSSGFFAAVCILVLMPLSISGVLPLLTLIFSGAAHRHFLPAVQNAHPLRRLLHAIFFSAWLTALLLAVYAGALWLWFSITASRPTVFAAASIACIFLLAACSLWLVLLILLAQVLSACCLPFFTALIHASRAALHPACSAHAATVAALTTIAIALHITLDITTAPLLLLAITAYAFALDALIVPWLMARKILFEYS